MRPSYWLGLTAVLLSCAGCVTTAQEIATPEMPASPVVVRKELPPVTAEQINEQNGHQIAQALWEEIDREKQATMLSSPTR